MKIDLEKFNSLVDQRYLSRQKHPTEDLLIFNYTPKTQFSKYWTEETMMARGLITDLEGKIVARPFKKFFNLGEQEIDLPAEDFIVTEKMDGSLGILYPTKDGYRIATRGSFTSEQSVKGTELLLKQWSGFEFNPILTYLFEIIYPENRIVVDYAGEEKLVLLAVVKTATGDEYPVFDTDTLGRPVVLIWDGIDDIAKLKEEPADNREGFVIQFKRGLRLKLKFDEYVRLHRLVTGVNARTIWDLLRNKQPFDELLERVPDEFYTWVKQTKAKLEEEFEELASVSRITLAEVKNLPTRKEQAAYILDRSRNPGVIFSMLDDKDWEAAIWQILRPSAAKPFKEDES